MRTISRLFAAPAIIATVAAALALVGAPAANADSYTTNFESFSSGSVSGQDGWQFTGPYDAAIADTSGFALSPGVLAAMGTKAFRISNASTSGSFGDWVFSRSLANDAGEASADGGGYSGGTRQSHFEASFDITSAVPGAEQPGLQFSLAPDRGDGARMSFLKFSDNPGGINVQFSDYLDRTSQGPGAGACSGSDDFSTRTIASGLDRSTIHNIMITMDFLPGRANDRVEVYVDGALAGSGTSWEDYFRDCEGNPTRPVDSLIFQARDGGGADPGHPGNLGNGFLLDNLSLSSGPIVDPVTAGTWDLYPVQGLSYTTKVRPPINADGSSNWPKKKGVVPVQFDLYATTGPAVFESIYTDNTSVDDGGGTCGTGSGADHANDCAFLRFTPSGNLAFTDLTQLVSTYNFTLGDCHGGSLRWSVRLDTNGDGMSDGSVFIYYGGAPNFTNCTAPSQSGVNMIGFSDERYDSTQLGGPFYGSYAETLSALGTARVLRASLVLDSGWAGDQRLTLGGATANGSTFTPAASGTPTKTCDLPQAKIEIVKNDANPDGVVNETPDSVQNRDDGVYYRNVDCKYIYNLDVSTLGDLSTRQGTYRVYVNIAGTRIKTSPAFFDLR